MSAIGLIAGSGAFPFVFARAAREQGLTVHAVAHRGEADPALAHEVESLTWVKLGQAKGIHHGPRKTRQASAAVFRTYIRHLQLPGFLLSIRHRTRPPCVGAT